jgi:hypothetical protein
MSRGNRKTITNTKMETVYVNTSKGALPAIVIRRNRHTLIVRLPDNNVVKVHKRKLAQ